MTDNVTPTQAEKPRYLLMKRDLYYGPNNRGYTGIRDKAGRYFETDAMPDCGVTAIHEDDAPEFSKACFDDLARDHLQEKIATQSAEIARLSREVDRLKADNLAYSAQCKKLSDSNRKLIGALEARPPISVDAGTWWYPEGDTSSDVCCQSPDEVVESTVDDMAEGDRRVIVIERALSLPDVYGLIRVFTESEKATRDDDEPWTLDLYATEDEAHAALSAQPDDQGVGK